MDLALFDPALIERYDRPGPRYTSYPTAAQFTESYGASDYLGAVQRSRDSGVPLSLYVHVPFCASPCFYCGCNRIISRSRSIAAGYIERLEREIEMQAALFAGRGPVLQLHFGGGTPTFFSLPQMEQVMQALDRGFGLSRSPQREYSIEVDPRALLPDSIAGLAALGFNRISIGVQDFDPAVQEAVNRLQSYEQTEQVVLDARRHGFNSVSVDLIYGLPKQTLEGFGRTLDQVIALAPDRVSAYSYAHMPQLFKAQGQINGADLPSSQQKLGLLQLTVAKLQAAGYVYVGMDHFARPDDELARALDDGSLQRNFQGYSTRGGADLVGLGLSAISRIADSYCQNVKTLDAYYAALDTGRLPLQRGLQLSADDRLRRALIEDLMCRDRVDCQRLEHEYHIDFRSYFADALEALKPLAADGLVELGEHELRVTAKGRFLLRAVAMPFDAHLRAAQAPAPVAGAAANQDLPRPAPRYSRVI
ncbi:MAG: oxygen-independent coproporphyrinogen III oxidase [Nevskiaceae bacterium]|nr:MAG: oxygen-independent coproporphyrinogen III oxidase [Nevskiaceae bacterium]TAM32056.1 MAG: oxygen-independent coproporphyrinogen III oxidase [Nevskiaceae bacterium]